MSPWETIPGETPIDISGLKIKGVTNRRELNIVEAANIRKAVVKYLAAKPSRRAASFTFDWCLQLHGEMFGDVWQWAGEVRTRDLNLGIPHHQVRGKLNGLLKDLECWPGFGMEVVEQATRLHFRAVDIHPFENGNGRWSRMLANIWLQLNDHPPIVWPEEVIGTESVVRNEYLAAIRSADAGDYQPLIAMHRRYIENT